MESGNEKYVLVVHREGCDCDNGRFVCRGDLAYDTLRRELIRFILEEQGQVDCQCPWRRWEIFVVRNGQAEQVWGCWDKEEENLSPMELLTRAAHQDAVAILEEERKQQEEEQQREQERRDRIEEKRRKIALWELKKQLEGRVSEKHPFLSRLEGYMESMGWTCKEGSADRSWGTWRNEEFPELKAITLPGQGAPSPIHEVPSEREPYGVALVKAVESLAKAESKDWDQVFETIRQSYPRPFDHSANP